jgi:L-lactate dehydrogenase complex protein LldE
LAKTESIQLFRSCLIDNFYSSAYQAVLATFEATGVKVCIPDGQTCCGQLAYNAGFWGYARQMAQHTIRLLEASPDPIIIPSGSCTHMIRHGYPTIFRDDLDWLERAENIAARSYEWSEFVVDVLGVEGFRSSFKGKIAYHASCHLLRGLGVDEAARVLLTRSFNESQLVFLSEECCGFGGVFAVEFSELSTSILDRKVDQILASGAELVTGCDESCLMQIEGRLRRIDSEIRCAHLAELFTDHEPGWRS